MQILSVELENVKSYTHAKIDLTPGVNAIVGHNGAGKSTILEAIGFALFDTLGYRQEDFVRSGARHATATITFLSTEDERPYQVVRRVGSSSQYYVHDPELNTRICDGKADVMRFLQRHLGVEPGTDLSALFKDAVGVPQGTLTAAFLLTDSQRKPIFDALLRVDEYEKVWQRLREPVNLLRDRIQDASMEIAGMEGRLEQLPELQEAVQARQKTLAQNRQSIQQVSAELETVQQERAHLDEARTRVAEAERKLGEAKQRQQGIDARLMAARQSLADAEAAAQVVSENQAGFEQYQSAQERQQELEKQQRAKRELTEQYSASDKEISVQEAESQSLEQELQRIEEARRLADSLRDDVTRQDQLEAQLHEAQQQQTRLEDARRNAQQLDEQKERLVKQQQELEQKLQRAQEMRTKLQTLHTQIEEQAQTIEDQRNELASFQSRAEVIKEQTAQLQDVTTAICPVCEQPLTEEHRLRLLERNESELADLRRHYRELQAAAKAAQEAHTQRQEESSQLQDELLNLPRAEEQDNLAAELQRVAAAQEESRQQIETLRGAADRAGQVQEELNALNNPRQRFAVAQEQAGREDAVRKQLGNARAAIEDARRRLNELQSELERFSDLDSQLDAVAGLLTESREAYQAVLSNRRQADELPTRRAAVEDLNAEAKEVAEEVDRLANQHAAAAEEFDAGRYETVVSRERELGEQVGGLRAQVAMLEDEQQRDHERIEALEELRKSVEEARAQRTKMEQESAILEQIRGLLRQAGPYITKTLIRQISEGARQIFSDLMQDYSRHLGWNEDYSITMDVGGYERQFSQLSGGEQMSAALAVRLALLREMSSIDIAFFDEPTANLDATRREALARQILHVRGFQQLFVISHDDTFEQATQNLIRVEQYGDGSHIYYG